MVIDSIVPLCRVIYSFPDSHSRDQFCDGKYLELISVNEDFVDSETDLHIEAKGQSMSCIRACTAAAELHGAEIYYTCGGDALKDCVNYQKTCGRTCEYCQYTEERAMS